jgi:membrane-bound serine protease (ClpP class)
VVAGRLALHARTARPWTGTDTLIGREVTVASTAGASGQAWVEGAWWRLRSRESLEPGDSVRVRDVDGLDLVVDRTTPGEKEMTP